jgi:translation elongation factor EF-Tu-like GTPase
VGAFSFVDKMSANEPPIRVRALLSLLPTGEGGRQSPAFSGYRPNHNFGEVSGREFYIGEITFARSESILPGESKEVDIEFINGPGLMDALRSGRSWRIQEGPKLVATAILIEILGLPDQSGPRPG